MYSNLYDIYHLSFSIVDKTNMGIRQTVVFDKQHLSYALLSGLFLNGGLVTIV